MLLYFTAWNTVDCSAAKHSPTSHEYMQQKGNRKMSQGFNHFDENGNAVMVDVSAQKYYTENSRRHRRDPRWTHHHGGCAGRICQKR